MTQFSKPDWRLACRLAVLLQKTRGAAPRAISPPTAEWEELRGAARRLARARELGWLGAARVLMPTVEYAATKLIQRLEAFRQELPDNSPPLSIAASDVFRDLAALRDEFEAVDFEPESKELAVTTAPIELDGVELGQFDIRLDLTASPLSYRVVALDPNPAASKSHVTHPHVSDESLCEGDGAAAIRLALAQGRLHDFYVLVHQILATYARGQAYVELDAWHGYSSCEDCGVELDEDEVRSCDHCGNSICSDCVQPCGECEIDICNDCGKSCQACDCICCQVCVQTCDDCEKNFCNNCLVDGLCPKCHANQTQESETAEDSAAAQTAIQPECLGEALVPAESWGN